MRIGIVTITDGANYGNRLQNYALSAVLSRMGHDVYTVTRKTNREVWNFGRVKRNIKKLLYLIGGRPVNLYYNLRRRRFDTFNMKYIRFSKEVLKFNSDPDGIDDKYDLFVCGSDQVWNPRIAIIKEDINNYLLDFASNEKKVAYSASFGADNIPEEFMTHFSKSLMSFRGISVRELDGAGIVRRLTGKTPDVTLDPTMLLSKDDWEEIEEKPKYVGEESIICTYFLGRRTEKLNEFINQTAKKYRCRVVNLESEFIKKVENREYYFTAPQEFLWLIHNAKYFFTDSFHGCVFSIIFGTEFWVFSREIVESGNNMSGRIQTLLDKFGLRNRLVLDDGIPELETNFSKTEVEMILQKEKDESIAILNRLVLSSDNSIEN